MIYSERLIFEEPKVNDFDRFYEINADPETNFFNPNGAMNFETAKIVFDEILNHWQKQGFGTWCIKEIENPDYVIGFGGLSDRYYGNEIKLNLGYRFDKNFWGKGYATELSDFSISFGFKELNVPEIFAIVRPKHLVSIKVLEKCNMKLIDELNDVPGEAHSLIYCITK